MTVKVRELTLSLAASTYADGGTPTHTASGITLKITVEV